MKLRFYLSRFALLGLAVTLLFTSSAWATPRKFVINDESHRDHVEFTSDAPVELIKGHTNRIKGHVIYDDSFRFDAKHPFDIVFEVDLASIDTGIGLRNQHMRDNFLETAKYPKAIFKATKIETTAKPPFKSGQVVAIKATGLLTVHGKTVTKTVPLKVTYFPESDTTHKRFKSGNMIRIRGTFPVSFTDHAIQRPEMLFQKLAETVFVSIDAFGTDTP